ncbi:MAG: hypothetical protein ACLRWN_15420 [Eisenbergiella sp.]|uniref:hypothetical protein n=1 Tax=Eisenbergiella sp. TaxID=1924109 RepID=UPI003991FCD9
MLLCGYATDACLFSTTAGYENLQKDFNVFIVGDCTMAVFPAQCNSETATKAALCKASLDHFITQTKDIQVEKTHIIQ